MLVSVNEIQAGCLVEYSELTGVPVQTCLDSAIDDWIRSVAVSQIEKPSNLVVMERREA